MTEAKVIILADYVSRRDGRHSNVASGELRPIRRLPAFDHAIAYLHERERTARKRVADGPRPERRGLPLQLIGSQTCPARWRVFHRNLSIHLLPLLGLAAVRLAW